MSTATALTLINEVLRGLRRDVVTTISTTDAYHLMLLQMLNIAKNEIEAKWDWEELRTTVTVTLSGSTQVYTLSTGGAADANVTNKSRLLYEKSSQITGETYETSQYQSGALPQVFDVTGTTEYRLTQLPWEKFERLRLTDDDNTTSQPGYFSLRRQASGHLQLGIYPMPSGSRTLSMRFVIPQAAIPNTFLTNYTLSIAAEPVWTKALWRAAQERGEDTGRPAESLQTDYENAEYFAVDSQRLMEHNTSVPV